MPYEKLHNQTAGTVAYYIQTPEGKDAKVILVGVNKPTLFCYVHIVGQPMQMKTIRGTGYDRITTVISEMDNQIGKVVAKDFPTTWLRTLHENNYKVVLVL